MKKFLFIALAAASLVGCSETERGATVGALGGAAVGAVVTGDASGAVVGGLVGGTAGALIGHANERGKCYYRDRHGRRYIARC